ncbi:hypothetical protein LOS78_12760 [Paracoccus sp. MA]|uniref:head-tail joining protein n=1 Tax=Paracoccus sp. MA TaxID=2895796 RepID=UPI001E3A6346|nr:hypothetical protein [Paracoccus sp. MA]UFM66797.1 hypothetical protein LOS78_12760 [Paracoccus sp. MA]
MTQPPFDEMFAHMSGIFAEIWGAPRALRLTDGREVTVPGIWRPDHVEQQIGDYVSQRDAWPRLDLRRQDLIAAGVTDPESDLHDAIVEIDGKTRRLVEIRDDGRAMVKCRCALDD